MKRKPIERLCNAMVSAGYDASIVAMGTAERPIPCIIVKHNYSGVYPSEETMRIHHAIRAMAAKAGYYSEPRGHYVSTFIYSR